MIWVAIFNKPLIKNHYFSILIHKNGMTMDIGTGHTYRQSIEKWKSNYFSNITFLQVNTPFVMYDKKHLWEIVIEQYPELLL